MKPKQVLVVTIWFIGAGIVSLSSAYFVTDYLYGTRTSQETDSGFGQVLNQPVTSSSSTPTPTPEIVLKPVPDYKSLSGGTHIFQTFNNCGPASLSMALSYYGITRSQAELGNSLRPWQNSEGDNDDKSVTLVELAAKAEEMGFVAYRRPSGTVELVKHFINYDIPVITRTWLNPGEDIGHYRVITGYNETSQTFIQDDSLQGANLEFSYDDFKEIWQAFNYEFLVLVPEEKVEIAETILGDLVVEDTAWHQALNQANQQLMKNPNDVYANFNKVVALYELGEYQEAIDIYEAIENRLPSRMLWYQIEPVLVYYQNGDYDRVMNVTDQVLNNHNMAFSELHQLRGLIYQIRGQTDMASQAFNLADQYGSDQGYWLENLE